MPPLDASDRAGIEAADWLPEIGPFGCFGRSWFVRTDDHDLRSLVDDLYADLRVAAPDPLTCRPGRNEPCPRLDRETATFYALVPAGDRRGLVTRGDERLGRPRFPPNVLNSLVWGINRWVLDAASWEHVLLHAGGVVRGDGLAMVLPAPSGSGKSTLTTGLLDRGLAYLSDEAVAIAADRTVAGYPKPLSLDPGAWPVLEHHRPDPDQPSSAYMARQWHVRASSFTDVATTARVGLVVFPRFGGTSDASIARLGPSEAVMRAAHSTFSPGNGTKVERHQIEVLAESLSSVPAYAIDYSDLAAACKGVLDLLDDAPDWGKGPAAAPVHP